MAVTAPPRAGDRPAGRPRGMYGRAMPPRRSWEFRAWLFMRISGLVLLFLAVGHVLIMHVLDEGVDRVDFQFVAVRWGSPFWQTWDWLMLSLALLHGINGLRVITLDYVRRPAVRASLNVAYAVIGFALFVLGTVVVWTFDCSKWPGVTC